MSTDQGFDDMFNDPALRVSLRRTGGKTHPLYPLGTSHMRIYTHYHPQGMPQLYDEAALAYMRKPTSYFIDMSRQSRNWHGHGHHGHGYGSGYWHAH